MPSAGPHQPLHETQLLYPQAAQKLTSVELGKSIDIGKKFDVLPFTELD
jgi:hypothetical protein